MHDKTIRRRRAVLLGLVAVSLLLLTAYFGESNGGGLHSVQNGTSAVLTPIQEGASRALKPVRDGAGWVGDTFHAKSENKKLKQQLAQAQQIKVDTLDTARQNVELRKMLGMDAKASLDDMGLVPARVISGYPNVINQVIKINQGSSDGIRADQAVVTGSGLVGKTENVGPNFATVELVTDADFGAGARIADSGIKGTITPAAGSPRELRMDGPGADDRVDRGQSIVTSGTSDPKYPSPFPPGLLIGSITEVDEPGTDTPTIKVAPAVDVRDVNFVQVITKSDPGTT